MTLSPCPPQTPAPSRTASFSESRADEVAPAKKAKPAVPQGNSQRFRNLPTLSPSGPCWASRGDGRRWGFAGTVGMGWEQTCGVADLPGGRLVLRIRAAPGPPHSPPPSLQRPHFLWMRVSWAERLRRRQGYRSPRRWEGFPDSTRKWRAGSWSSGGQSKLPCRESSQPPRHCGAPTEMYPFFEPTIGMRTGHQPISTLPTSSLNPDSSDVIPASQPLQPVFSNWFVSPLGLLAYASSLPGMERVCLRLCEIVALVPALEIGSHCSAVLTPIAQNDRFSPTLG